MDANIAAVAIALLGVSYSALRLERRIALLDGKVSQLERLWRRS